MCLARSTSFVLSSERGCQRVNTEPTLRASLSDTFLQRKDVVNQCLEFAPNLCVLTSKQIKRTFAFSKQYTNYCMEKEGANMWTPVFCVVTRELVHRWTHVFSPVNNTDICMWIFVFSQVNIREIEVKKSEHPSGIMWTGLESVQNGNECCFQTHRKTLTTSFSRKGQLFLNIFFSLSWTSLYPWPFEETQRLKTTHKKSWTASFNTKGRLSFLSWASLYHVRVKKNRVWKQNILQIYKAYYYM